MIKLLKKVTFFGNSLLRIPSFGFASASNVEFHKAVLASRIISTIRKSPLNEYQSESFPSLKEAILEEIRSYEEKNKSGADENLVKQAAKEVRNCFDDGVYLPQYMCGQNRNTETLKLYQQVKEEKGQIEILNAKETDPNQMSKIRFRKLSFVPTYIITGQIFRSIFKELSCNLLTGQYGVGKTYSFVLYTLLSEMVFRYRHQQHSQGNDDLPQEIDFKIPKAVYISMNPSQMLMKPKVYEQKIKDIFKFQCYQLKDVWKNENIFTLSEDQGLSTEYSKLGIWTILLNDQINEVASILRKLQQIKLFIKGIDQKLFEIENQQLVGKTLTQTQKKQHQNLKEQRNQAQELKKKVKVKHSKALNYLDILNRLVHHRNFGRFLYLSSVDIEKHLLDDLKLLGDSKQGSIHPLIMRLDYPISLSGNIAIADTCEFIILHLKSYWKRIYMEISPNETQLPQEQKEMLKNIKKQINAAMREKQYYLVIPLKIKQLIGQLYQTFNSAKSSSPVLSSVGLTYESLRQCDPTKLNQTLHNLIERLQDQSVKSMACKFQQFLKKETKDKKLAQLKSLFSFRLWAVAEHALRTNQVIKNEQKIHKNQNGIIGLRSSLYINASQYKDLLQNHEYKQRLSELFFSYDGPYLEIKLNPEVIRRSFHEKRKFILEDLLAGASPLFDYVNGDRGVLGTFLENIITKMLKIGKTDFSYILKAAKQQHTEDYYKIHQTPSCFIPIPQVNQGSYRDYYFLNSFKTHFETLKNDLNLKERNSTWNLLSPLFVSSKVKKENKQELDLFLQGIIKRGIQANQIDKKSKLIDFSLCKIQSETENHIIKIDLFDVTVKKEFIEKIYEFLAEYMHFEDRNELTCKIGPQEYKLLLTYNLIITEDYDGDFKKVFKKKIESLEKTKILQQSSKKILDALKSFNFKNYAGGCAVISKKTKKTENFCLKKINIISLKKDKVNFQSSNTQIQLDKRIFKRVVDELEKFDKNPKA